GVGAGQLQHVADGDVQGAADEVLLVGGAPLAAQPRHDLRLDLQPDAFGVDEQTVHVEQHGLQLASGHSAPSGVADLTVRRAPGRGTLLDVVCKETVTERSPDRYRATRELPTGKGTA